MSHRTTEEQIEKLLEEIRRETDPDLKLDLRYALRLFYGKLAGEITNGDPAAPDIFISHSSTDAETAEALVELIIFALDIRVEKIRCTSLAGFGLVAGAHVYTRLRNEVYTAKSFIVLLTQDSLKSTYVSFEWGARLGAGLSLIPVMLSAADRSLLQDPLKSYNAVCCDSDEELHQLMEDLAAALKVSCRSPAVYQKKVDALIAKAALN